MELGDFFPYIFVQMCDAYYKQNLMQLKLNVVNPRASTKNILSDINDKPIEDIKQNHKNAQLTQEKAGKEVKRNTEQMEVIENSQQDGRF